MARAAVRPPRGCVTCHYVVLSQTSPTGRSKRPRPGQQSSYFIPNLLRRGRRWCNSHMTVFYLYESMYCSLCVCMCACDVTSLMRYAAVVQMSRYAEVGTKPTVFDVCQLWCRRSAPGRFDAGSVLFGLTPGPGPGVRAALLPVSRAAPALHAGPAPPPPRIDRRP